MLEVNRERLMEQYRELAQYVRLKEDDFDRIRAVWPLVSPDLEWLVEDFYTEIERHLATRSVMRGGPAQVQRLKQAMAALDRSHGNKAEAARQLGIARRTLYRMLEKYGDCVSETDG